MELRTHAEWWPGRQLRQHPLRRVLVCGRKLKPPLYSHVVGFLRIEIPLRGHYRNQLEVAGQIQDVSIRPGMALLAAPNCWNLPEWRPGLELLCLGFGTAQVNLSVVAARTRRRQQIAVRKSALRLPLTGPVPHIVNALEELSPGGNLEGLATELTRALIHGLEDLVRQPERPPVSQAQRLLDEIRVFLQSHYQYEITRDAVARQFEVSPNHLSRLFRTHGRMTFSGYLTQVRIDRAKHLLRNYNLKLGDIAARCGYHDTPYFCNVFKNVTTLTPKEYRLKSLSAGKA
jgi:AraC-like DNA-binding protein